MTAVRTVPAAHQWVHLDGTIRWCLTCRDTSVNCTDAPCCTEQGRCSGCDQMVCAEHDPDVETCAGEWGAPIHTTCHGNCRAQNCKP